LTSLYRLIDGAEGWGSAPNPAPDGPGGVYPSAVMRGPAGVWGVREHDPTRSRADRRRGDRLPARRRALARRSRSPSLRVGPRDRSPQWPFILSFQPSGVRAI
jgi:hypothetical protein